MSTAIAHPIDPHKLGHGNTGRGAGGPADKRIIVGFGFWVFLLSDIIMFSAIFAAFAVLQGSTAGGPSGKDLFDLGNVAIETGSLLLSSFVCGLAMIAAHQRNVLWTQVGLFFTG